MLPQTVPLLLTDLLVAEHRRWGRSPIYRTNQLVRFETAKFKGFTV
jgi:hypothetical protein